MIMQQIDCELLANYAINYEAVLIRPLHQFDIIKLHEIH